MKRLLLLFFALCLLTPVLRAQSLGNVPYGARIFSTGLPSFAGKMDRPDDLPMMSKERRETALECIEWTFGKVKEYKEAYGECCAMHHLNVVLENGDELDFEEGRLVGYTLITPKFLVGKECMKGGLRVGRKPGTPLRKTVHNEPRKHDPSTFGFEDEAYGDVIAVYEVDSEGIIVRITVGPNEC